MKTYVVQIGTLVTIQRGTETPVLRPMNATCAFNKAVEHTTGVLRLTHSQWPGVVVHAYLCDIQEVDAPEPAVQTKPVCEHCKGAKAYKTHGKCWACRGKGWQDREDLARHAKYLARKVVAPAVAAPILVTEQDLVEVSRTAPTLVVETPKEVYAPEQTTTGGPADICDGSILCTCTVCNPLVVAPVKVKKARKSRAKAAK